jgi:hypothetical protein
MGWHYMLLLVKKLLVGGWATPLKNDGVRQLGWWNSQLNGKIKFMFQTTNQINMLFLGENVTISLLSNPNLFVKFWGVLLDDNLK